MHIIVWQKILWKHEFVEMRIIHKQSKRICEKRCCMHLFNFFFLTNDKNDNWKHTRSSLL